MYSYKQAKLLLRRELETQARLSRLGMSQALSIPLLLGPVGSGKTALAKWAALEFDLMFCPMNSGENSDATDVSGVPMPADLGRALEEVKDPRALERKEEPGGHFMEWVLNRYAALACEYPVLLFFDDLDKAPPPVQNAMLGITGERRFRDRTLHPGTLILCAGNRLTDDEYANQISESMRTRVTILEMEPDVASFTEYGRQPFGDDEDEQNIHPAILGFLQYKPSLLHDWKEEVNRFPTPRGWWEASRHFYAYPDPAEDIGGIANWKSIVARKCGGHVASDFWAWFEILRNVDIKSLLTKGTMPPYSDSAQRRMAQYAAIFKVAHTLTADGVKKSYAGLERFIDGLEPEARVALAVQLPTKVRAQVAKTFPAAGSALIQDILRVEGDVAMRAESA